MMLMTDAPEMPQGLRVVAGHTSVDGQVLTELADEPAGAWLAVLLDQVDVSGLGDDELPVFLQACQRMTAWAEARLTVGVAELASRPSVAIADRELAVALREPAGAVGRRVWVATRVTRLLPGLRRAFQAGTVSARHVAEFVKATGRCSDPDVLAVVQERALALVGDKTPAQFGRHARDLLRKLDPAAAQKQATAARDDADVIMHSADDDGMSDISAHLPVEDAAIVKAAVDAYAMAGKKRGDPRRVGQLRADGLTRMCAAYLTGHLPSLGPAPRSGGRPVEIAITVDLPTALGLRELPGEVPGAGLVPRQVIADLIANEAPRLRLLVIDEHTGRLLHRAVDSYRPTPAQTAHARATYVYSTGPGSQVPASRCDIDHVVAHPDGPTVTGNLIPLDRTWHNAKTRHGLTVTINDQGVITITTPLGQTRTVTPYDYRTWPDPDDVAKPDVQNPDVHDAAVAVDDQPPF